MCIYYNCTPFSSIEKGSSQLAHGTLKGHVVCGIVKRAVLIIIDNYIHSSLCYCILWYSITCYKYIYHRCSNQGARPHIELSYTHSFLQSNSVSPHSLSSFLFLCIIYIYYYILYNNNIIVIYTYRLYIKVEVVM